MWKTVYNNVLLYVCVCVRAHVLWQYLRWREQEGIIGGIMFCMLFGLPVALAGMAYGVYGVVRGHKVREQW